MGSNRLRLSPPRWAPMTKSTECHELLAYEPISLDPKVGYYRSFIIVPASREGDKLNILARWSGRMGSGVELLVGADLTRWMCCITRLWTVKRRLTHTVWPNEPRERYVPSSVIGAVLLQAL